jgi:uncharacterized protein (TIGR02246 family)
MRSMLTPATVVALVQLAWGNVFAAEPDPHAEDRKALLKVFREMEAAINDQNVDRMASQMHPLGTITWWNAEISRGHDEIKAYYHRMVKGEKRYINKYTTEAKVAAPARFFGGGEVAVADGTTEDKFFPVARDPFQLSSRWTATATKHEGQWKIAALHLSSNVFTNSLINEAKDAVTYVGAGAGVAGLVVGFLIGRRRKRT